MILNLVFFLDESESNDNNEEKIKQDSVELENDLTLKKDSEKAGENLSPGMCIGS